MTSINKVMLIGHVGQDPKINVTKDNTLLANLSVATNEYWKDKNTGLRKDKTEWHRVVVMNDRIANFIKDYVKKGSRVYVEGQLQTRKWTDRNDQEQTVTEVVVGRFKGDLSLLNNKDDNPSADKNVDERDTQETTASTQTNHLDDDIPF